VTVRLEREPVTQTGGSEGVLQVGCTLVKWAQPS
jgi:hypothetical protein